MISSGAILVILCVAFAVVLLFLTGAGNPDTPQEVLDHMIDTGLSSPEKQQGIYFCQSLKEIQQLLN